METLALYTMGGTMVVTSGQSLHEDGCTLSVVKAVEKPRPQSARVVMWRTCLQQMLSCNPASLTGVEFWLTSSNIIHS